MQKIKYFLESEQGKDVLIVLIVVLVGLGSFELGRLSKRSPEGLKIEFPEGLEAGASIISSIDQAGSGQPTEASSYNANKSFFASSKGTKYYSTSCSAGKTIKQENRVYFSTREQAESVGYSLSSSCR